jgi:hypothetical protein
MSESLINKLLEIADLSQYVIDQVCSEDAEAILELLQDPEIKQALHESRAESPDLTTIS